MSLARNGRQALEALQSPEGEHINLILTDVLMPEVRLVPQPNAHSDAMQKHEQGKLASQLISDVPEMQIDGIELMSELLKNESWSHIPIIGEHTSLYHLCSWSKPWCGRVRSRSNVALALSGLCLVWCAHVAVMSSQSSQESVLKAFEAGAKDYLIKPVRRNELATLWQHVWRVNRDLLPMNGSKPRSAPTVVRAYTGANAAHNGDMSSSPLHLLCEVASNEHQASSLQKHASRRISNGHNSSQPQLTSRNSSALSPVELKIRPLDVAPSHPSATRVAPGALSVVAPQGTHQNMPAALRELAALGNKLERERSKQARSSDEDDRTGSGSDAANTLRHSETTSPFQSFTAFVPRPCSRGDAEEPAGLNPQNALQQMSLVHDPVRESGLHARLSGHALGVTAGQQQQFFQAFQAAVEQHQLAVEACAVNRRAAIAKFREKRKARNFNKKVCLDAVISEFTLWHIIIMCTATSVPSVLKTIVVLYVQGV